MFGNVASTDSPANSQLIRAGVVSGAGLLPILDRLPDNATLIRSNIVDTFSCAGRVSHKLKKMHIAHCNRVYFSKYLGIMLLIFEYALSRASITTRTWRTTVRCSTSAPHKRRFSKTTPRWPVCLMSPTTTASSATASPSSLKTLAPAPGRRRPCLAPRQNATSQSPTRNGSRQRPPRPRR